MAFDKRKALQSALSYTQQGKWDRAIAEYKAILKADPRDLTVCNNLGDLYARTGKPADAIEQYLKLGDLYRSDGLSVKAIAVYKKIAKLDPNRTEAHLACADLYQEQGLVGEAKVQLATAIEHYSKVGDTPKLIEIYQRLTQLDPTNHALVTKVADLLAKQGMREAAAAEYGRAAHAAQAAGQTVESKRLFQKARDILPDSAEPNLGLAEFQLREGRYAEAVSALTKVTGSDSANVRAWRLLGEAYGCLGRGEEAIGPLQRAVALGLPEAEVGRPLALALVQAGRADEAVALCLRITEGALTRKEPEAAVSLCQALVAAAPHLTTLQAHLATLLQRLGRAEEARKASWALAAAYEAGGETEAAIHVYHQLLETDPSDTEAQAQLGRLEAAPAPQTPQEELVLPTVEEEPAPIPETLGDEVETTLEPQVPEFVLPALEEESRPTLETSADVELALAESEETGPSTFSSLEPGSAQTEEEAFPADAPAEQPFEAGEASALGEIGFPSIDLPAQESAAEALEVGTAGEGDSSVDFLGEGIAGLGALDAEEGASEEVAEQLAEAEVYLKYGLADKARDRFLEVVRLAPDNMVAHQKLKAIYVERNQISEACKEILAIAEILGGNFQRDAALREIQEGLELAPDDSGLRGHLARLRGGTAARSQQIPPAPLASEASLAQELSLETPEQVGVVEEASPVGESQGDASIGPPLLDEGATLEAAPALEVPLDLGREMVLPSEPSQGMEGEESGAAQLSLGDEELPPELRALLEDSRDEPAVVVDETTSDDDQVMVDDLAEASFYIEQGMLEEARAVYERMRTRDPEHPTVISLRDRLASPPVVATEGLPTPEAPPAEDAGPSATSKTLLPLDASDLLPPREPAFFLETETLKSPPQEESQEPQPYELPVEIGEAEAALGVSDLAASADREPSLEELSPKFTVKDTRGEAPAEGFINLGAELEEELAAEEQTAPAPGSGPLMDGLLKEFQKGVREHLDEKDFETHYNLGIAYKEMELYEEAVQEFRLAGRDPGRALACADLLGLCFLAIGQLEQSILELKVGLEIRGHPKDAYHAIRYDLGTIYETQGDLVRAMEQFEVVQGEDPRFRDVGMKLQSLSERLPRAPVPSAPGESQSIPRRPRDKKISFI
jgi:tetratricopeptide (TPR) repeat protein